MNRPSNLLTLERKDGIESRFQTLFCGSDT